MAQARQGLATAQFHSSQILSLPRVLAFFKTFSRSTVRAICEMIDCYVPPPNVGPHALLVLLLSESALNLTACSADAFFLHWRRHGKVLLRLAGSLEFFT
jgi:hypothetical protein